MRTTLLRAITATLLLVGAVALPAAPVGAATVGPYVEFTPPAVVGSGLTAVDLPVQVVNTGGTSRYGAHLRLTITPVAGSAVRPLAETLLLSYDYSGRPLTYETRGETLIATTPNLFSVDADGTATVYVRMSTRPTSTAPHVDEMTVDVTVEAVDDGVTFAADLEPDRMALVEPRVEMTGWPQQLPVGTPAVVTMTFANTTPLPYLLLWPALALYRSGNDQVIVERLDGQEWTRIAGPSYTYYWFYADGYPSLQPGETYTATLRITFTDDSVVGEQGDAYHIGYNILGQPNATDSHPYTIVARD